ncbi:serine protease [Erythrobacter litoralis]|uniref:S1 family peptidase n=1 Tax=Erythrobacter litoralis TaxID=39960 RepID=UPI002434F7FD|nr:serine protease [Erythrobacter litoralis]MDG6078625.1 serine protease [Erythrobacter litoralis]
MARALLLIALLSALIVPWRAAAEPADIDAAARGVVRVVIIGTEDGELYPISHGTGFAVTPTTIVTNAHVVRDAMRDGGLDIGIVPSGGGRAMYGRLLAVSPQSDLALIRITGDLRLPPLALAGLDQQSSGEVISVGYPMNVDRAQGLGNSDIFSSQPPVKSRGYISGERPSRQFDTILHTAPIARGNSGGPLLDQCGRVLGVNSFGSDSEAGDAEFFFAVSNRELIPFLRENGIEPPVNTATCRSMAELDAAEQERIAREQAEARQSLSERAEETRNRRERALLEAQLGVTQDREDRMALAFVLILAAFGIALYGFSLRSRAREGEEADPLVLRKAHIAFGIAGFLVIVAIIAFITRPGLDEVDRRVAAAMSEADVATASGTAEASAGNRTLTCTLLPDRSRVTSAQASSVSFEWSGEGCVNGRTQYGYASGTWSRVFVPNEEDAVSVNSFDPDRNLYRVERFLLPRSAMQSAREARSEYRAPQCGAENASQQLGEMQSEVLGLLPQQANERLVYSCEAAR